MDTTTNCVPVPDVTTICCALFPLDIVAKRGYWVDADVLSAKEISVLADYAKRKLRRPRALQESPKMSEISMQEFLIRYAKLHLFHLQTVDALNASQKRIQDLEKELAALKPTPEPHPTAPEAT